MPHPPSLPSTTAAELDLLRVLWRIGPADARRVHEAVAEERPEATYAGVLRQLQLMHAKGLLERDERQRPQRYAPAVAQDRMQKGLLKDVIAKLFAGSGKALVLAALKSHVSAAERAEIARLLHDEADHDGREGERS
jgi:predicted transcriptional regulator